MIPVFAVISSEMLIGIPKAAFGLGFVIFVHELGHFLVAKACGVKCEKFYVGFDVPIKIGPIQLPRAFFRKKWGETEYGIGIIPLGGYVKMLGQDDNPANTAKEAERIRVAREQSGGEQADTEMEIDPRSYPAKTVPQRLMIISAGVIMNLIFAVIFGMTAYRMGVSYTPCIVGSTSPGLSAWDVGLQTGDRIVQMGRDGKMSEHLRFDKDMMVKVMMTGANQKLDLLVQRYAPEGATPSEPEWIEVQLSNPQKELNGRPIIGISRYATPTIGLVDEVKELFAHLPAIQAQPELKLGDKIVAMDGQPVRDYVQISRMLAQRIDDPIELTVERTADQSQPATESFKVTIPPNPMRWLGLEMAMGPLVAIQNGSPAELAGFKVGDRVLTLNGEPIGDPLTLPDQLRRLAGQETLLTVQREGVDAPVELTVTPQAPQMVQVGVGMGKPLVADAIGIAFSIENTVAAVQPGSPASKAGLQVGDQLQEIGFVAATPESAASEERLFGTDPIALGDNLSWPAVNERIQLSSPTTQVQLTYLRDGLQAEVEMDTAIAAGCFFSDRGLKLRIKEEVHRVEEWGEAFWLGVRETGESISQVYFILFRLVTGQLSPMNLGGPAAIATMAGLEASESTARLLIFLTLLSANLAVINFLPIPVLDGGHATFLLYEGIFRRPVNDRIAFGLTMAGFCFILGLMLFVIGLDFWRLSGMAS